MPETGAFLVAIALVCTAAFHLRNIAHAMKRTLNCNVGDWFVVDRGDDSKGFRLPALLDEPVEYMSKPDSLDIELHQLTNEVIRGAVNAISWTV